MIGVNQLIAAAERIAAEEPGYEKGHYGQDGLCDCIGLIIGAVRRCGGTWKGLHGSNYAARYEMQGALQRIVSNGDLKCGEIVYKAKEQGENGYDLPDRYKAGGAKANGDLRDYYHVGIVESVYPLRIRHMTTPKPKMDTSIGKWGWHGRLKGIDYTGELSEEKEKEKEKMQAMVVLANGAQGNTVNMREGPSKSKGIMLHVPVGSMVEIAEDKGEWCRIEYGGKTGWMMSNYLEYQGQGGESIGEGLSAEDHTKIDLALRNAEALLIQIQDQLEIIGGITGRG